MVIGTALGWGYYETIALAIVLAFFFGYSLTMVPLLRGGLALATAAPLALASDTLSIAVMEIVRRRRVSGQPLVDRARQGSRSRPRPPLTPRTERVLGPRKAAPSGVFAR